MFIRKTRIRHPDTQKTYFNFQLVESVRTERGPRQKILLNLGANLELNDKEERKLLANRIEEILRGTINMFPCPAKIEQYAQKYAIQLQHQLATPLQEESLQNTPSIEEVDYQTIDLCTVEQQEPRAVGTEHVLLHIAKQLEMPQVLKILGLSEKEIALSLATIIGRATFPASERATHNWVTHRSGLGELIDYDFQKSTLKEFYQISDVLLKHKNLLEQHLEKRESNLYGSHSTMILYDLSNTYITGRAQSNPKAQHGFSKEKRFDCPLVTLGVVVNEYGFLKRSSFLPGNISEPSTLKNAIESLHFGDLFKPTIVMDAGIATEDNLRWLKKHGYHYIVSARQKAPSLEPIGPLIPVASATSEVKVAFIQTENKDEQWLYCESSAKNAVSSEMKKRFQERLETDLKKMQLGLLKPLGRKKYTKILERIGRLKEKHSSISGCYEITVEVSSDGAHATEIHWVLKQAKLEDKLNGHYFLRTNLLQIKPEELWRLYSTLRTVEDSFRFMKSSLGLRPVYHQKEHRVDGHLWITMLAYHLIHVCMHQLKQKNILYKWETIRNNLSTRMRVTMRAKMADGKMLYHRSTTKVEQHQKELYEALGISPQISKVKKVVL